MLTRILSVVIASLCLITFTGNAQFNPGANNEDWKKIYRLTAEKDNDLIHTKLEVKFDYQKAYLYGKAWITLKPHFYNTDTLTLDAKGMNINEVAVWKDGKAIDLTYTYADSLQLHIKLDQVYKGGESYTVFIDYTAKPNELKEGGSAAIKEDKGLYFINPKGEVKDKPTEIWTQGETEASSVWFPTIDKPNQKTTSEIAMTVPDKYVTLSNGRMSGQKKNADGTRTDTWKMDLPHSPYLFFMGVGDFTIVKDSYKGKEVSYYVEKDFEKVARKIFGLTPEMIGFYSTKLGVEYPWDKYSQMVGRDYVSGAMENTTATLHSEYLQQNARQLVDGNKYEDYISHELFHQWFGDLVTAESWSNLTVNESFADYSETLWNEYKHGQDAGDEHSYTQMLEYFESNSENKPLVRFYYKDKEDVFDRVTYEKGGRILNMLRNYVGDDAFFKSLNLYLNTYKFKSAEADNLRLAFEDVTGKDLTWFWNQWYFGSGHPKLDINYSYDNDAKKAIVIVKQTQPEDHLFKLPVAIDVYSNGLKSRYNVLVKNKTDTFSFSANTKPELINFDGDKVLLGEKKENKSIAEYTYQYNIAKKYVDRREAIDYAAANKEQPESKKLLKQALGDPYFELRERVLKSMKAKDIDQASLKIIENIALKDPEHTTRAAAIDVLSDANDTKYTNLFTAGVTDSSYSIAGASLEALAAINESKATALLPKVQNDTKGRLKSAVEEVQMLLKGDADFDTITRNFDKGNYFTKINDYKAYLTYLGNVYNTENFKKGIDKVTAFRDFISGFNAAFKPKVNAQLQNLKRKKLSLKTKDNETVIDEQIAYLDKKIK